MAKKPSKFKDNPDTADCIRELQRKAEELAGGELLFGEAPEMSEELREQFWERVVAIEEGDWVTPFELLVQGGMELPEPEELDDAQLTPKLWEVIRGLAMLRMFLYSTDHLNDRELYEELWHSVLREEGPRMALNEDSACHIDLVSSGSAEDIELYLRYYADEETRRDWAEEWPDEVMPAHQTPPYDRDRHLPARHQAEWRQCHLSS